MRSPVPLPTAPAQITFPRNLLVWLIVQVPFNQMDMPICPSKSHIAGLTGHPDQRVPCRVPLHYGPGRTGHVSWLIVLCLSHTWDFQRSVGKKGPSENAARTHPLHLHRELQS
ncbi:hypothetical protein P7K49_038177 [Saguinus oedipus]|uniref:Uncharacterized protein n=1 Tax=Saguinus oedipus TaxID=9490 RepID=A0ABQ9TDY6_SAGOE|nr:hypothetical protein P7K49_038177 [Saguinus oedipus]